MKRSLLGAVAASALIVLAACGGAEDTDTDMTEDIAPPPVAPAPADTMMADTMMVDTMTTTTAM